MEPLFTRHFWRGVAVILTITGMLAYLVDDAELAMLCGIATLGALCMPARRE